MKGKPIYVHFSEEADDTYKELQKKALEQKEKGIENSFEIQLLNAIDREKTNLKLDPQRGLHIPRRNIPKSVKKRYGTDRLWKINLISFWRMIYTITGNEIEIITFILEIMDHKKYNKVFGYR